MKKLLSTLLAAGMLLSSLTLSGCSSDGEGSATSGKLVFAIWDNNLMEYADISSCLSG